MITRWANGAVTLHIPTDCLRVVTPVQTNVSTTINGQADPMSLRRPEWVLPVEVRQDFLFELDTVLVG